MCATWSGSGSMGDTLSSSSTTRMDSAGWSMWRATEKKVECALPLPIRLAREKIMRWRTMPRTITPTNRTRVHSKVGQEAERRCTNSYLLTTWVCRGSCERRSFKERTDGKTGPRQLGRIKLYSLMRMQSREDALSAAGESAGVSRLLQI